LGHRRSPVAAQVVEDRAVGVVQLVHACGSLQSWQLTRNVCASSGTIVLNACGPAVPCAGSGAMVEPRRSAATAAIHTRRAAASARPVSSPIFQSTAFAAASADDL